MDLSYLEGLGLTQSEIKTYITLLELGETKVGRVIEKSNLVSSAAHNSINSLIDKGLVSFIKKGQVKHYKAVSPKQLVDFIDEKKKRVLEILPELEAKEKKKDEQEAEIFEGIKGITAMLNALLEDGKNGEEYLFFAINANERTEEALNFFTRYHNTRISRGLKARGLAPKGYDKVLPRKGLQLQYTTFPIPKGITIFRNRICFYSWGEKPIGYFIKSKQLVDSFKELFNEVWNKS